METYCVSAQPWGHSSDKTKPLLLEIPPQGGKDPCASSSVW